MKIVHEIINLRPLSKTPTIMLKGLEPLIECGFPLPHEGENIFKPAIDVGKEIVTNSITTYVATAWSDSMEPRIFQGDLLLVDRALEIRNGHYVAAVVGGGWTMKRIWKQNGKITLFSENPAYEPIEVREHMNYREFGRIYKVIQDI